MRNKILSQINKEIEITKNKYTPKELFKKYFVDHEISLVKILVDLGAVYELSYSDIVFKNNIFTGVITTSTKIDFKGKGETLFSITEEIKFKNLSIIDISYK